MILKELIASSIEHQLQNYEGTNKQKRKKKRIIVHKRLLILNIGSENTLPSKSTRPRKARKNRERKRDFPVHGEGEKNVS